MLDPDLEPRPRTLDMDPRNVLESSPAADGCFHAESGDPSAHAA